ncbi:hypothetical protein OCU04_009814 [Sclerotinia nivalis]|uniref:DNA/RNA-binding domain-containing protein n=1 Tax=Sclerotinia nivalis TaxID=352851 RepID=A0A9X0AGN4_9HELO|nr:hypothetical protein OCU04_009814 [Sclerotinia nivalis]
MNPTKSDVSDLWIQHQRQNKKTAQSWACIYCPERKICLSETDLWEHAEKYHQDRIPSGQDELERFRKSYESNSALKRPTKDDSQPRSPSSKYDHGPPKSSYNKAVIVQADTPSPHLQSKRPLNSPQPDPFNIASTQASKPPAQVFKPGNRRTLKKSSPQTTSQPKLQGNRPQQQHHLLHTQANTSSVILSNRTASEIESTSQTPQYSIILQPVIRPISQEQLAIEAKGIYAGLAMIEAKCIEVDNKQATLVQDDPPIQSKLNNKQWQALISLHRTLLDEQYDFLLVCQHPSASPTLRQLPSKCAMPARMWRHSIQSLLELLRHRLPASFDHMLAFIYLVYSRMTLLYETVPTFEDIWIECLGDLGRYRMILEDKDARDRELWVGVARHWYLKASDKAPTIGRLYHHLAILAHSNPLQQLYYYTKSLCAVMPFTYTRKSILMLFDPVLNTENGYQYRLPSLDNIFIRAHGHLFTGRTMERFEPAIKEFLGLLDHQIGRTTKKFMEQGSYIAMLGFASEENPLMKAIVSSSEDKAVVSSSKDKAVDVDMDESWDESSPSMIVFRHAQNLNNSALEIVLKRIGDPNVLPFIHISLVFIFRMSHFSNTMDLLAPAFPWQILVIMLNTLLKSYKTFSRIEDCKFPLPEKDDICRPFLEDFGMRGLLWTEKYFPERWFLNEKIDEEEKYHEFPSILDQRKERILWLACRIADAGPWITFDSFKSEFSAKNIDEDLESRSPTFASATTN